MSAPRASACGCRSTVGAAARGGGQTDRGADGERGEGAGEHGPQRGPEDGGGARHGGYPRKGRGRHRGDAVGAVGVASAHSAIWFAAATGPPLSLRP